MTVTAVTGDVYMQHHTISVYLFVRYILIRYSTLCAYGEVTTKYGSLILHSMLFKNLQALKLELNFFTNLAIPNRKVWTEFLKRFVM